AIEKHDYLPCRQPRTEILLLVIIARRRGRETQCGRPTPAAPRDSGGDHLGRGFAMAVVDENELPLIDRLEERIGELAMELVDHQMGAGGSDPFGILPFNDDRDR